MIPVLQRLCLCLLFLLWAKGGLLAQKKSKEEITPVQDEYYQDFFRYQDWTYRSYIRTVQLRRADWELSSPLIKLNTDEKLRLSFDDLDGDVKDYSYTLVHCDASWQASGILNSDFLSGFYEEPITEHAYSFNTVQKYTHWSLVFPTENMKITKSGNYVIKVYTHNNPDSFVISRRFMVCEDLVGIKAVIKKGTDVAYSNYRQEIDFLLNSSGYNLTNPYSDLKVVLTQNERWDNAIYGLKPMFVKDKELDYNLDDVNSFPGGSEFRRFDTKSIRWKTDHVKEIYFDSAMQRYRFDLITAEKRAWKKYNSDFDMNGNYIIKVQEGSDSDVEADYVYVNIFLAADAPAKEGNFYVFGALSDWQCKPEFKLIYNTERGGYECTLLLKQGYYNYEFVFLKDGEAIADNTVIEGMHFETENDYTIWAYHREIGGNYDRLIAVKRINSAKNQN
ncbi:MAG: DUF5103 domain-containing protein [Bacteroidota bacterium]